MSKVFADQSLSLDGFSTGVNIRMDNPIGDGGERLHEWQFREGVRAEVLEDLFGSTGGGTTYTFVTDGLDAAVAQARATAGDRDVVVLGGATIIQQCMQADLLDELRLHLATSCSAAGPVCSAPGTRTDSRLGGRS